MGGEMEEGEEGGREEEKGVGRLGQGRQEKALVGRPFKTERLAIARISRAVEKCGEFRVRETVGFPRKLVNPPKKGKVK